MANTALDTGLFRKVMGRFATGVTVITAEAEGGVRGMTANAFMSGSLAPPLCIISVATKAKLHNALTAGRTFGVSMLAQGQEANSRQFAGQAPADPEILFEHMHGVPVLANVCAALAAEIEARHDCGDHTIFVGRVIGLRDDERQIRDLALQDDEGAGSGDRLLGTGPRRELVRGRKAELLSSF